MIPIATGNRVETGITVCDIRMVYECQEARPGGQQRAVRAVRAGRGVSAGPRHAGLHAVLCVMRAVRHVPQVCCMLRGYKCADRFVAMRVLSSLSTKCGLLKPSGTPQQCTTSSLGGSLAY